jgi:hypothetical protein
VDVHVRRLQINGGGEVTRGVGVLDCIGIEIGEREECMICVEDGGCICEALAE